MSDTGSTFRRFLPELCLGAFIIANLALMPVSAWPTLPFHLIWVGLTVAFGIRMWQGKTMWWGVGAVVVISGVALFVTVDAPGGGGLDEMTEVPLMTVIFLVTVWHVRTRQRASDEVCRMADRERRLLESQREFVLDSAHGLRTPITVARGHAEMVREGLPSGAGRDDIDVVLDELDRLARMSSRLLILAAAEHPDFLDPSPIDLRTFLNRIVERWAPTTERRISCAVERDGTLWGDAERLELLLDALIENAVRYTDEHGSISLTASTVGDHLLIDVVDDGTGIGPDEIPRVFSRFARAATSRGGTGLGLPIARAIAESHGGKISIRSDSGTCVSIELPNFSSTETGLPREAAHAGLSTAS